jgi:hypothetical protein
VNDVPLETVIQNADRLVHTTSTDIVTVDDFLRYQHDIWRRQPVHGFNELLDLSNADLSETNFIEFLAPEKTDTLFCSETAGNKLALVARSETQRLFAHFYQHAHELMCENPRTVEIFLTFDDAHSWLLAPGPGAQQGTGR